MKLLAVCLILIGIALIAIGLNYQPGTKECLVPPCPSLPDHGRAFWIAGAAAILAGIGLSALAWLRRPMRTTRFGR